MKCKECNCDMQIVNCVYVPKQDSNTEVFCEQEVECKNPNCSCKGIKVKIISQVN